MAALASGTAVDDDEDDVWEEDEEIDDDELDDEQVSHRSSDGPEVSSNVCECSAADADEALLAIQRCTGVGRLVDESHYSVTLIKCDECDQRWLIMFYEAIDWENGDDSQAWVHVPITAAHAELLLGMDVEATEEHFTALNLNGRHLVDVHPRGGGRATLWHEGTPPTFPHD